jgi:ParB/RepB/Spo0J family partition protein
MKSEFRAETFPLGDLRPDPHNARTTASEAADAELTASIARHGVKVPLICFQAEEGIVIADGHRRWRCAQSAGLPSLPAIIWPKRPSDSELLLAQLTINAHRENLNPIDEYEAFTRLAKLQNWTPTQLATGLAISQAEVTRVLSIGKLTPEERELVRHGKVSKSAGYALARMPPAERSGLAQKAAAGELTRDRLDALARRKPKAEKTAGARIRCAVPQGTVTISAGRGLNLTALIELLEGLVRNCRKLRSQKLDIATAMRVLRDQSAGAQENSAVGERA